MFKVIKLLPIFVFLSLIGLGSLQATTIAEVIANSKDKERFEITGEVIGQIDDDEFLIKDSTGELRVEIQQYTLSQLGQSILKKTIKVTVIVDKEMMEHPDYDAIAVEIVK